MRVKGTVKWFNKKSGYGFLIPVDESLKQDVFVHITTLQSNGIQSITEGQELEFDMVEGRGGKMAADNVSLVEKAELLQTAE